MSVPTQPRPQIGVGGPGLIRLDHFGRLIFDAYGHTPFLVGSAAVGKQWRDVDVRLMLPDDEFDALFPSTIKPWWTNQYLSLITVALSTLGHSYTGLPIDFQFQPLSHANEHYGTQVRVPIGLRFASTTPASSAGVAPEEVRGDRPYRAPRSDAAPGLYRPALG